MQVTINYKKIRNGYVRVQDENTIVLSIPRRLEKNETFKNELIERGKLLLQRYQKKEKIQTNNEGMTTLFGEQVPISELLDKK